MSEIEPAQPRQPTPGGGMAGGHANPVIGMLLVFLGGATVVGAAFLPWAGAADISVTGTEIGVNVFWSAEPDFPVAFLGSAGFVVLIIGAIALIGVLPGARMFGVVGGILGIVAAVLVAVSALRSGLRLENLRPGLYLVMVGGLLALIGSLVPTRPPEVEHADAEPAQPPQRPPAEPPPPA